MKLVTVAEMQAIEREADAAGLTYEKMMENAGTRLGEKVEETYGDLKEIGIVGLVGSGNNGGDTLVALTWLAQRGWKASACSVRPRQEGDPLIASLQSAGGIIFPPEQCSENLISELLQSCAVLMDGVLGTGVRLPLKEEVADTLAFVQQTLVAMEHPPAVVAVDVPSGVDSDTGEAAEQTIPADMTVTMAAVKRGLLKLPAFELAGDLQVVSIGIQEENLELDTWNSVKRIVPSVERIRREIPARPLAAHKGTFGTALIVAGSINYPGAAILAAEAAYRIGAGLVTLAAPVQLYRSLAGRLPEATWLILPDELGVISADAAALVMKNLDRPTAMLVGPGFGMEESTQEFLSRLFAKGPVQGRGKIGFMRSSSEDTRHEHPKFPPLVLDADGLKLVSRLPDWPALLPPRSVLTPHPGEMEILTGLEKDAIQAERVEVAERFSKEWGHVVVLKGAFTVIAAPDGQTAVIPVASPALARAGTGDVLAGLITGLRAQGVEAFESAMLGAWIHAQAGLRAAEMLGTTAAVLAGDVLAATPGVMAELG